MDNWGLCVVWSVPLYFALTNRLKGLSQGIALWVYFWGIGALLAVSLWHGFHEYLSYQQIKMGPSGVELLSRHVHMLWLTTGVMVLLFALPPAWYLRDRRKVRLQSA